MYILFSTLFFAMWSRFSLWVSPFVEAVKEKVSLLIKFISPSVNQDLSSRPSVGPSFCRLQMTPPCFLVNLFKSFGKPPMSDIEQGTHHAQAEDIVARRFSRPKKWINARVEQTRESCTTIPSFFVAEASRADDEWHVRYRRDVLGIISPATLAGPRFESTITLPSTNDDGTDHAEPSSPSYTTSDYTSSSLNEDDILDESDICDEIITPSASTDSPLVIQIFTPRISSTPTIDNLAMGLHTPFTPDGIKKPLPIDTDPYDLMVHLFGDEFTRMDQGCIAKLLATNEIFSIPTASVGLAIELALSNENVISDIPWVSARPALGVVGPHLGALRKSPPIQGGTCTQMDSNIDASMASLEEMSTNRIPSMLDPDDFVVTGKAVDPSLVLSGLIPVDEGNAVETHNPDSGDPPTHFAKTPLPTNTFDVDTLADLPVFLAMSEQPTKCGSMGSDGDDATSPLMEAMDFFPSPSTLTSNSSPEPATPGQITDIYSSPSVYLCRTLDDDTQSFCNAKDGTNIIKLDEQPPVQALHECEDLEHNPDLVIRYKRQGIFIQASPPPPPSRLSRTPSARQTVPTIPLRTVNVKCTRLPIKRHASKPCLTTFVTAVVRATSLRPSRSLETFRARITAPPTTQLPVGKQDPFAHINRSFHADHRRVFKTDIANLDIYQVPNSEQSPQSCGQNTMPAADADGQGSEFTDLIPTYVYDYSAFTLKNDLSKSNAFTPKSISKQPPASYLMDNLYGCPTNDIVPFNSIVPRFHSTYPELPSDKTLSTFDIYTCVSRTCKRQTMNHCEKSCLTTITKQVHAHTDDTPTTNSSPVAVASSGIDELTTKHASGSCVSLPGPSVTPPGFVTCPLISIPPPSVSSACLYDSFSAPVSVSDVSISTMDPLPNEYSQLSSNCTASTHCAPMSAMSPQLVSKQLAPRNQGENAEPISFSVAHMEGPKHKRRNFKIACPDDLAASRHALANMRVNDPPLPRLLPPASISGIIDSSVGLPALEDILVVNESYVSGLALPEGSPPRRVSAPSTCPFAAAIAAAARAAALGEIRHSGSNVPTLTPLVSRRQSVIHAHREPRVCNKIRKRPLHLVAKSGNRTSNLKPLVLPMKLALREANEVNLRLSSKLEALGSPDLSSESTSSTILGDSENWGTNKPSSTAIAAIIEFLDAANVPRPAVPPRMSNGSNNSSRRISPEWGVAF